MRYAFTILLGLLAGTFPALHLKGQSLTVAEADSLRLLLRAGKADTNRVHQLIRLGEYQIYKPGEFKTDMDSARAYAEQAQGLSRRLGFYPGVARSLNLMGTIRREAKAFEQSIGYHQAALRLYQQHHDWQGEANCYLLLGWAKRDKGEAEKARIDVQKAIALCKEKDYHKGVAQAYVELANTYLYWGKELDTRIIHYQQALQWFARAGDVKGQADVHKELGDLYQEQGSRVQALLELRKALALYQSIHYPRLQGVYDLLGNVSSVMSDYQEGLKYGLKAVQTAEALQDTTLQLCTIYNHLGMTYFYLKQYRKARIYYDKAMLVAQKYNDRSSIVTLTGNIATMLNKTGQMEASAQLLLSTAKRYPPQDIRDSLSLAYPLLRIYTQLKQYALAQEYCNQLLSFLSRVGKNNADRSIIYDGIIPFFIVSKQHGQARKYLAAYEEYCVTKKNLRGASYVRLFWFRLDSMQANYPSAIRHYQQYKVLQDSLLNETKSQQIASLEVLYETEKKERDLKLKEQNIALLREQNKSQQATISQQRTQRNAFIGGTALLLLTLGLGYNRYRLKQRNNRQLEAQRRQLQAQHEALQAQQEVLQAQQSEIHQKNNHLSELLIEKDCLLHEKDTLIGEKEGLLLDKDQFAARQQQLLAEKERLLREIHHRVKNNLQVIMSLLNSQANSLTDKAALSAIQESQHRVQAMALIHQKLYQNEGVSRIPMKAYIEEVVDYLQHFYDLPQPIEFQLAVDPTELDVAQAIPLGLIINEALTNALKYAFRDGRSGTIRLSLRRLERRQLQLTIQDDGAGFPADHNPSQSRSLGMTLMLGLSEQLGGALQVESRPGLSISLTFSGGLQHGRLTKASHG